MPTVHALCVTWSLKLHAISPNNVLTSHLGEYDTSLKYRQGEDWLTYPVPHSMMEWIFQCCTTSTLASRFVTELWALTYCRSAAAHCMSAIVFGAWQTKIEDSLEMALRMVLLHLMFVFVGKVFTKRGKCWFISMSPQCLLYLRQSKVAGEGIHRVCCDVVYV